MAKKPFQSCHYSMIKIMSDEVLISAQQRRLVWRCRRGMLELDIVLQRFVQTTFNALTQEELMIFDRLLDLPDDEFWEVLQSQKPHPDHNIGQLVHCIQQSVAVVSSNV